MGPWQAVQAGMLRLVSPRRYSVCPNFQYEGSASRPVGVCAIAIGAVASETKRRLACAGLHRTVVIRRCGRCGWRGCDPSQEYQTPYGGGYLSLRHRCVFRILKDLCEGGKLYTRVRKSLA